MANLNEIIRTDRSTFDEIAEGTHETETYDDNSVYQVELDDPIELAASGSGMTVNSDNQLVVSLSASNIPSLLLTKISDVTATSTEVNVLDGITATTTELNYCDGVTSNIQTQLNNKEDADATILKKANVVNNTTTSSTDLPLSANMGLTLQNEINNLKNIGRFLAVLDCSTGTVSSQPTGSVGETYTYKVGDYYRVGASGTYKPKGNLVFTIDSTSGSSNFETGSITYSIGDVIYCSNIDSSLSTTTWVKQQSSGGGTVQDVTMDGTTVLNSGTATLVSSTSHPYNGSSNPIATTGDINTKANAPTVRSNITVSGTPTALSSYNSWDTQSKYGYYLDVTISGLTVNTLVEDIILTDTIQESCAYVFTSIADGLRFYFEDSTAISGTIFTLVTSEVA